MSQHSSPAADASERNPSQVDHDTQVELGNFSGAVERCLRNFVLGKTIGAGTFSKVCIARHRLTNEQVAIKIIEKQKIENQADRVRLDREMKIMRKVKHPNITQLYQIIETKKYIYLVMEYASRGQLFDHIVSQEKLTEFEASKFLLQLVDAIQYMHMLGIAHRDLKPENLLLDHKFNIKVTDFGLSNIYPAGKTLTTACGSPSYACPEMLSSKPYDGLLADIWSAGIVLYAMCFGYLPFDNPNANELYRLIKQGHFEIPETATQNLVDILQRILQVNPQNRITVDEIRAHPFCRFSVPSRNSANPVSGIILGLSDIPYEISIEKQMENQLKLNVQHLREQVKKNKHNQNTCTYYLLLQRWLWTKNESLSSYYSSKYNIINRYALIQKVKANYDRMQRSRMEIKKFQIVQEQIRRKNKGSESHIFDSNNILREVETAVKKQIHQQSNKKVIHSANAQKSTNIANKIYQIEEELNYLKSKTNKHFAPNNTKKSIADSKIKPERSKSKRKSPNKSKSKKKSLSQSPSKSKSNGGSKNNSNSKKKHKKFEISTKQKEKKKMKAERFLVPEFVYKEESRSQKSKSISHSRKKQRVKTLQKQQKSRKRNKSVSSVKKLQF